MKGRAEPVSTYFEQGDQPGSRQFPHFDALGGEHTRDGIRLISNSNISSVPLQKLLQPSRQIMIRAEYDPDSRMMTTLVNDEWKIQHQLEALVLAPSQVQLSRNDTIPFFTYPRFTGAFELVDCRIGRGESIR